MLYYIYHTDIIQTIRLMQIKIKAILIKKIMMMNITKKRQNRCDNAFNHTI